MSQYLDEPQAEAALARWNVRALVVDDAPGADEAAALLRTAGGFGRCSGGRFVAVATLGEIERAAERAGGDALALLDAVARAWARADASPPALRLRDRTLPLDGPAHAMGILNVTPDSFYERHAGIDAARRRAHEMVEEGATIVDIGGQSYADWLPAISPDEERQRVEPVVAALVADGLPAVLSIDTYKAAVADAALAAGAHLINDCSGLIDPELAATVARYDAGLVVMHQKGGLNVRRDASRFTYEDAMREIAGYLTERLDAAQAAGVAPGSLVIDPGLQFGKEPVTDLEILDRFADLATLGYPILFASSRKSFIGRIFNRPAKELLVPSLATAALGIAAGARILRVHDVAATVQLATMMAAVAPGRRERLDLAPDMPGTGNPMATGTV